MLLQEEKTQTSFIYRELKLQSNLSTMATLGTGEYSYYRGSHYGEVEVQYDTCFFRVGATFLYLKNADCGIEIPKTIKYYINKTETKQRPVDVYYRSKFHDPLQYNTRFGKHYLSVID